MGNQSLVTWRIAGFQDALDGYLLLEVQEFAQEQIELFVRSWFADTAEPDERAWRVDGLLWGLGRNPRMRLLASNPLLLSLMALLYERNWRLPERRVDLYEECVGLLTAEWDRLKGVRRPPQFSPADKQRVLTQVAAMFHEAGVRVFDGEQLLTSLAQVLPAVVSTGSRTPFWTKL
jgi:predicted NACHT family NTPase